MRRGGTSRSAPGNAFADALGRHIGKDAVHAKNLIFTPIGQQKSTLVIGERGCNRRELLKLLSPCVPFTSGAAKNASGQPENTLSPHQPK